MEKHLEYLNQLDKNEIDNFKRTWMHNLVTMKWLRTRHVDKAKKQYLFFPEELHKHYEINELFRGFDADQSEGIDIQELINMFKDNKILLDRQDVEAIFKIIDFNGDHTLNLSEFKKSVFSDDINSQFAKVMRYLREKIEKKEEIEKKKSKSFIIDTQFKQQYGNNLLKKLASSNDLNQNQLKRQSTKNYFKPSPSSSSLVSQFQVANNNNGQNEQQSQRQISNKNIIEKEEEETQRVVPTTFSSMVEFFSYNFQRKEQIKKCKKLSSTQVGQKVDELTNLMNLNSKFTEQRLQKIQKLSNKYVFHSYNLLGEAEEDNNNNNDNEVDEKENGIRIKVGDMKGRDVEKEVKRIVSDSLEIEKDRSDNKIDIKRNGDVQNKTFNIIEKQFNNQDTTVRHSDLSSMITCTQPVKRIKSRINLTQSPINKSFLNILKKDKHYRQQSMDNSHSTQDKTGNIEKISSIQQLNQTSKAGGGNRIQSPFFSFNKNTQTKLISSNTSQEIQITAFNSNASIKKIDFSRNQDSPSKQRSYNKLSKILHKSEQMRKESFKKFLSSNNSPSQQGSKRQGVDKEYFKKISEISNNQGNQISNSQQSCDQMYKDVHILNGTTTDNMKQVNNPFGRKKRQSNFMNSSSITSIPQQIVSLQHSSRQIPTSQAIFINNNQTHFKNILLPDTQFNSMGSLLDELATNEYNKNNIPILNKIHQRKKQTSFQDIPLLSPQQQNQSQQSLLLQNSSLQNQSSYNLSLQNQSLSNQQQLQQQKQYQSKDYFENKKQNNSLSHLFMNNTHYGSNQNFMSQNNFSNNGSCKIQVKNEIKDTFNQRLQEQINRNEKVQQVLEQQKVVEMKQSVEDHQRMKIQQETIKKEQEEKQSQTNLEQLYNKKRQLHIINLRQNCDTADINSSNKGIKNYFDNKNKFIPLCKANNNAQSTTPSTINESLMVTLNTFNKHKTIIIPIKNQQQI